MTSNQFSIRLREARKMMGLSMGKLAELTDGIITKQSISRYEKGLMLPKRVAKLALAKALNISDSYFDGTNISIDVPMLRTTSDGKLSEDELQALEAKLSFWAEQYLVKEKQAGFLTQFKNPIEGILISTLEDAIHAADLLREKWHCGDGPIASILRLLERKGIMILAATLPGYVFGMSTWADKKHPLMILDFNPEKSSVEKLRFTAAHELAHLLLLFPEDIPLKLEKRCDLFASFFLLP
uniref:helix-turn-helix domain-containing protein n=1 Tax=Prevotella sp. TaxID=59823 RepID=UPI003FD72F0F